MLDMLLMVASLSVMTITLNRANGIRVPFPHNMYVSMAAGIAAYITLAAIVDGISRTVAAVFSSWAGVVLLVVGIVALLVGGVVLFHRWRESRGDPFGSF